VATAPQTNGSRRKRNRDEELLDAAVRLFHEKGYPASSMKDVAEAVGVLKGSLYHYISSKEDLLFRILQESHQQASEIVDEVSGLPGPAVGRLRAFVERMYLWYLDHSERVGLYFNQQQYLTGDNKKAMVAQARDLGMAVRRLLTEAKREGSLDPRLDVKLSAFFLMGALNSIPMWYMETGSYSREQIAELFTRMSMSAFACQEDTVDTTAPDLSR